MKSPNEIYKVHQDIAGGDKPWIAKHLTAKRYDAARNVLVGYQTGLYSLALMQLRWGFDGLAATMEELDSLLPLLDETIAGLRKPWSFRDCPLDAHLRLTYLLERPPLKQALYDKWVDAKNDTVYLDCIHKNEVALQSALTEGGAIEMPCVFKAKKHSLENDTYQCYFELHEAVVEGDVDKATAKVADGAKLYKRRARKAGSWGYLGYDGDNPYLFDFQLTALIEFARRRRGWELPSDEAHETALNNAAAFREANPTE